MTYVLNLAACALFITGCSLTGGGGGGGSSSSSSVTEPSRNLPDLCISAISWRVHNRQMEVVVGAHNIAVDNCPGGFTISVSDLSGITRTQRFDSVLLAGGRVGTFTLLFPIGAGITSDVITARVDSLGVIAETDEGNNETIERCAFPAVPVAIN